MPIHVSVDGAAFWRNLQHDIRNAADHIYVQTLSFEGDSAGVGLAKALVASRAPDRRVIADDFFARHRINDRLLMNPRNWRDSGLRAERRCTMEMYDELRSLGVGVRLANPSGPLAVFALERDHKKIVVIDDRVAYLGGINFSEHNFGWHDMMLRIEDESIARFLKEDFLATWEGRSLNSARRFGDVELVRFDGRNNPGAFAPILERIAGAKRSVYVVSPYVTFPFTGALRRARERGATVTVITPEFNNWAAFKDYVLWESDRSGFDVLLYPHRMLHMKAMLIDDACLIAGSSNFDFLSHHVLKEIVAVITDADAVRAFRQRVLDRDIAASRPPAAGVAAWKGYYQWTRLKAAALFGRALHHTVPRRLRDA